MFRGLFFFFSRKFVNFSLIIFSIRFSRFSAWVKKIKDMLVLILNNFCNLVRRYKNIYFIFFVELSIGNRYEYRLHWLKMLKKNLLVSGSHRRPSKNHLRRTVPVRRIQTKIMRVSHQTKNKRWTTVSKILVRARTRKSTRKMLRKKRRRTVFTLLLRRSRSCPSLRRKIMTERRK
jgi:hypothetical protein